MLAMRQVLGVGAKGQIPEQSAPPSRDLESVRRRVGGLIARWGAGGAMGPGRTGAGRREPPRERADSVPHTPGGATPPFKSGCWMLVKNHFFSKCYNRAVTFYFLFFLRVLIFQRYTLKGLR